MTRVTSVAAMTFGLACLSQAAFGQVMQGKVVMEDGSIPPQRVIIERVCPSIAPIQEALTGRHGEYYWRMPNDGIGVNQFGVTRAIQCLLRARMKGLESDGIDYQDPEIRRNIQLPVFVLHAVAARQPAVQLPRAASKAWESGMKALTAQQWREAEQWLRDVTREAPQFAMGWSGLALASRNLRKPAEARAAFERAIMLDPASLPLRLQLARLEISSQLWEEASKTAEAVIQADTTRQYPEAWLDHAIARYSLHDIDGAQASVKEALRLDPKHRLTQAEYLMGAVLSAKADREGAAASLRSYLEHAPLAANADVVKTQIEELTRPMTSPMPELSVPAAMLSQIGEETFTAGGEALAPGGRKALAAMARVPGTPGPEDFFLEYCRAVAIQTSWLTEAPVPGYAAALQAYVASIADLMVLGERRQDRTVITLSLASVDGRRKAQRILSLLGWRVTSKNGSAGIEPGDQPEDGPRQPIPRALGIDELVMQETLEAGKNFQFEVLFENATLAGGAGWGAMLQSFPVLPGGIAEAFVRDPRLAKTYAGLGAMGAENAMALAKLMGLRLLVTTHAEALWLYGDAFRVSGGKAVVPGGAAAEGAWTKLAGASPRDPARFFQALLTGDRGRLSAFYFALARADEPHQKFFTRDAARAERFYSWYRDSEDLRFGVGTPGKFWRNRFFQNLPLDETGAVRFPGGRQAWSINSPDTPDDEAFFPAKTGKARTVNAPATVNPEALMTIARLEHERGASLDAASAKLLAENFAEWRSLFPYFAALPGLGAAEFQSLAAFSDAASGYARTAQHQALGEWHSLVKLIVLGRRAGTLDDAAAARAFGLVCRGMTAKDHSAKALAALREFAPGAADPDDAIAAGLLRLSGPPRAAFDRVRDLQNAPRLGSLSGSSDPAKILAALSGAVYGAVIASDSLLVNEDRELLSKHVYAGTSLFTPASLVVSSASPGSHLAGGFANLEEATRGLALAGRLVGVENGPMAGRIGGPGMAAAPDAGPEAIFRADGRLVEVHATVTDDRGRYVDNLTADQFTILEGGRRTGLTAFENSAGAVSCALLLDTSHSMEASLPALKSAAMKLIGALRPADSAAVYSLSGGISELQTFTTDKAAATRAVLRAELGSLTALYDGLVRVTRDLAGRTGRKVIVVFTDGADNSSSLTAETAILRAKTTGVPIYTIQNS